MKKTWDQFNQGVRLPHFHLNSCELNAKLTVKKLAEVTSKKIIPGPWLEAEIFHKFVGTYSKISQFFSSTTK